MALISTTRPLMPTCRALVLAITLACVPMLALAEQPIEQQMTPEQFKAAGLDKLSPQELANLNAWLNKTVQVEATKAVEQTKERIDFENRGFGGFGRSKPIEAHIVGEFNGFARGRSYTLDNGQVWQQGDDTEMHGVHMTNAAVRLKPALVGSAWYMTVEGRNTAAMVRRVK